MEVEDLEPELVGVARANTPGALRELSTPALDAATLAWQRTQALPTPTISNLIDAAIEQIDAEVYRKAAHALVGSGEDRWRPLSKRDRAAARQFGVTYDAFRRARGSGRSRRHEVLREVAVSITRLASAGAASLDLAAGSAVAVDAPLPVGRSASLADEPRADDSVPSSVAPVTDGGDGHGDLSIGGDLPVDRGSPTAERDGPEPDGRPTRRGRVFVSAAAVVLLVGAAIAWLVGSGHHSHAQQRGAAPESTAASPGAAGSARPCGVKAGAIEDPQLQAMAVKIAQVAAARGGTGRLGCPAAPVGQWQRITYQKFGVDPTSTIVLGVDADHVFTMTFAEWSSYHEVGGKSGDNAQTLVGLPIGPPHTVDGHVEMAMDNDGLLVGEAADAPFFFLLTPVRHYWDDHGGASGELGLPRSNPTIVSGGLRQDFTGGYLTLGLDDQLHFTLVTDPAKALPAAPLDHRILRHSDGTTWWISADGSRHWIGTGKAFACLGGWDRVTNDVPGYAVATLPYGRPAMCGDENR